MYPDTNDDQKGAPKGCCLVSFHKLKAVLQEALGIRKEWEEVGFSTQKITVKMSSMSAGPSPGQEKPDLNCRELPFPPAVFSGPLSLPSLACTEGKFLCCAVLSLRSGLGLASGQRPWKAGRGSLS